jgi:hypothetical protein
MFSDGVATEKMKGESLHEAVMLSNKPVAGALGGLPA